MAILVGTGNYRYRIIEDWAKLPEGWSFKEVAAVGVDKNDNVYVGEVCWTLWPGLFPGQPHPAGPRAFQKYERVQ
jgi:hypothetical protein